MLVVQDVSPFVNLPLTSEDNQVQEKQLIGLPLTQ